MSAATNDRRRSTKPPPKMNGKQKAAAINAAIRQGRETVLIDEVEFDVLEAIQGDEPEARHSVKNRRIAMGYQEQPPTCRTCRNLIPERNAIPHIEGYRPPHCSVGDFRVANTGICDAWTGPHGEALCD